MNKTICGILIFLLIAISLFIGFKLDAPETEIERESRIKMATIEANRQAEIAAAKKAKAELIAANKASSEKKRTIIVDSLNLNKEFSDNEIKAEEKYKGKILVITSQVRAVSAKGDDRAKIMMGLYGINEFYAYTPRSEAASLDVGQVITVKCENVTGGIITDGKCTVIEVGKIEPLGLSGALQKALKNVK